MGDWAKVQFGNEMWGVALNYVLRGAAVGIVGLAMLHFRVATREEMGLKVAGFTADLTWTLKVIGVLVAASLVLMAAGIVLIRILKPPLTDWPLELITKAGGNVLLYLCWSVIAAPLVEEFVYRSLMIPGISRGYSERSTVILGALLFYALHLAYRQPWYMLHYLVAGGILTWAFLQRRRLWICVLLHAGGNLLVILDDVLLKASPAAFKAIVGGLPR